MNKIDILKERLKVIGIDISLTANYPWIYMSSINGISVTEKFRSSHGFTVALLPVTMGSDYIFTDVSEVFKLIRMYVK